MRWMYGPELERGADRPAFDPVAEGERYRLGRELSLAIWDRACAEATDGSGRLDLARAQQWFHELATRIAARGGRLDPDVGKRTRVETEAAGGAHRAAVIDDLFARSPGRSTRVLAESQRRPQSDDRDHRGHRLDPASRGARVSYTRELPGASDVASALAALSSRPDRVGGNAPAGGDRPAQLPGARQPTPDQAVTTTPVSPQRAQTPAPSTA